MWINILFSFSFSHTVFFTYLRTLFIKHIKARELKVFMLVHLVCFFEIMQSYEYNYSITEHTQNIIITFFYDFINFLETFFKFISFFIKKYLLLLNNITFIFMKKLKKLFAINILEKWTWLTYNHKILDTGK